MGRDGHVRSRADRVLGRRSGAQAGQRPPSDSRRPSRRAGRKRRRSCQEADAAKGIGTVYAGLIFTAFGLPFLGSILVSKETFCPSLSEFIPDCSTAEMWTKTSGPPPSTTMKPKPFCSLKNFTVPVGIGYYPRLVRRGGSMIDGHCASRASG